MKIIGVVSNMFISAIVVLSSSLFVAGLDQTTTSALSGSEWRAGNIISDSIFYDNTQMSEAYIQQWLNSTISCDTNGDKVSEHRGGTDYNSDGKVTRAEWAQSYYGYTGKFVCVRDYAENPTTLESNLVSGVTPAGALSAAQIIKQAADTYKINPKVLLVKIRKESPGPLTADEWPMPSQFDAALGYGCPDPPAGQPVICDPAYKGFYRQITQAAKQLRNYVTYSNSFRYKPFQNNNILYNPNTGCGLSSVYLQGYATAGLYNYTPYQPNAAALNNLYGTGDSCSAYGNRNFWTMYNTMFGPTQDAPIGVRASSASNYAKAACSLPSFSDTSVARLYHPDKKDYLYTTSSAESCVAISYGYIWDGFVMRNAQGDPDATPIYRLANYERHLYTSSAAVRDDYIANRGYHDEGVGFYANSAPAADKIPVIGLQKDQTFWFTSASKEAELSQSEGYHSFGAIFYTQNLATTPVPLYRLTNKSHTRMYTTSELERQRAKAQYGYADEGVVTQNDSYPNTANSPVYRLRSPWGTYFYTTSRFERDLAVINYGYYSEGVGFYGLLYGSPAYRSVNPLTAQRLYTNSLLEYSLSNSRHGYALEGVGWYGY